jgi:hypothetical protein
MQERRHGDQEILSDLAVLYTRFDAMDEKLDRIYEQTLKTNGRVSGHDTKISAIEIELAETRGGNKSRIPIVAAALGVIGAIVSSLFISSLNK